MSLPSISSSSLVASSTEERGYQSINTDNLDHVNVDIEESPLASGESNTKGTGWSKGVRRIVLGALLGVIVVLVSGKSVFPPRAEKQKGVRVRIGNNTSVDKNSSDSSNRVVDDDDVGSDENDPFQLSPVGHMGMLSTHRNDDASPSDVWGNYLNKEKTPLPTNSWYLNLVSHRAASKPDDSTRVYTVPYIVDTASPIEGMEGLRIHWPVLQASNTNVQMVDDFKNSLCLGSEGFGTSDSSGSGIDGSYKVTDDQLSHLGVGLEWGSESTGNNSTNGFMSTHIVRGMPFVTMKYQTSSISSPKTIPTIYSYNGLASDVQIDLTSPFQPSTSHSPKLVCDIEGGLKKGNMVTVQSHLHLHFINSDFTWIIFFNKPVKVSCVTNKEKEPTLKDFKMSITESEDVDSVSDAESEQSSLIVRVALLDQCTTGQTTIKEHCLERNVMSDPEGYEQLLKDNARLFPKSPTIDFEYSAKSDNDTTDFGNVANMLIDWDATSTKEAVGDDDNQDDLIMYALPHHQTSLSSAESEITPHCVNSFHGNTCLVRNSKWVLEETLGSPLSFLAPRPPEAEFIPIIARYLPQDIRFQLSDNTLRGAADTYFSGKFIARLARVIVIASELKSLASASSVEDIQDLYYGDADLNAEIIQKSMEAASKVKLPSSKEIMNAVDQLKSGVQAWLKSDAEAPYIYDKSWGGLVNCGCRYVGKGDKGHCNNTFPDCPALLDVNEDFGNGYYNDHHYHYGYHVYAAAVAAKYDPSWGREHFDEILLYIRDFANPHDDDEYFPQYRQKDWFLGSSWASGIVSAENSPHGRNEESSSEAISAYEGVTLFGSAMVDAFEEIADSGDNGMVETKLEAAKLIRDSGQFLTASEIHATNRYWHLWSSDTHNNTYPESYSKPVVGMLYDTMATFQTWFAPWDVVSFGIQLIPLTPVAETRDNIDWAKSLYPQYEKACDAAGDFCEENGWTILQAGLLATTGNRSDAIEQAKQVPQKVFSTDGGGGNSMSNTLWYIATRK
jgi:endoglucanase Acf2